MNFKLVLFKTCAPCGSPVVSLYLKPIVRRMMNCHQCKDPCLNLKRLDTLSAQAPPLAPLASMLHSSLLQFSPFCLKTLRNQAYCFSSLRQMTPTATEDASVLTVTTVDASVSTVNAFSISEHENAVKPFESLLQFLTCSLILSVSNKQYLTLKCCSMQRCKDSCKFSTWYVDDSLRSR